MLQKISYKVLHTGVLAVASHLLSLFICFVSYHERCVFRVSCQPEENVTAERLLLHNSRDLSSQLFHLSINCLEEIKTQT